MNVTLEGGPLDGEVVTLDQPRQQFALEDPDTSEPVFYRMNEDGVTATAVEAGGDEADVDDPWAVTQPGEPGPPGDPGAEGPPGPPGQGLTFAGAWDAENPNGYAELMVVEHAGGYWWATADIEEGREPGDEPEGEAQLWAPLTAVQGPEGPAGPEGPPGEGGGGSGGPLAPGEGVTWELDTDVIARIWLEEEEPGEGGGGDPTDARTNDGRYANAWLPEDTPMAWTAQVSDGVSHPGFSWHGPMFEIEIADGGATLALDIDHAGADPTIHRLLYPNGGSYSNSVGSHGENLASLGTIPAGKYFFSYGWNDGELPIETTWTLTVTSGALVDHGGAGTPGVRRLRVGIVPQAGGDEVVATLLDQDGTSDFLA